MHEPNSMITTKLCCPECHSSQIQSDYKGFYVCGDCGLVLDVPLIQNNTPEIHTDDEGQVIHQNGVMIDAGTCIGNSKERYGKRKYRHLQRVHNMTIKRPVTRAFAIFSHLRSRFEVNIPVSDLDDHFKRFYPKVKKGSKSRSLPLLCSTLFYLTCKKRGIKLNLPKILAQYSLERSDYFDCVKGILDVDPQYMQQSLKELNITVGRLISRIIEHLHLSSEILSLSQYLVRKYRMFLGEKPEIIAGAAVGIALKIFPPVRKVSNFTISKELQVTASTVYSRVKNFNIKRISQRIIERIRANTLQQSNCPHCLLVQENARRKLLKSTLAPINSKQIQTVVVSHQIPSKPKVESLKVPFSFTFLFDS